MLELSSLQADTWRMGFAGDSFNTLWTMRALLPDDWPLDYVSAFGDDPFSAQQIAFFKAHGIGIASSPLVQGARPGLYAITLQGAERSFTYWRADAAARQLASDPDALALSVKDRALVYFSGISLAILEPSARERLLDVLAKARASGTTIAFDPNYRPRLWSSQAEARAWIGKAIGQTDTALPTFSDEHELWGDASVHHTAERVQAGGASEIAVKDGDRPALVTWRGGLEMVPAPRIDAVDTTGAGDAFNGAYLVARLFGDAPPVATGKAHRLAGAVVLERGALAPFPTLKSAFEAPLSPAGSDTR